MASMSDGNKAAFQERIQRIKTGGAGTMGEILVGPPDEEEVLGRKKSGKKSKKPVSALPSWRDNIKYPLTIAGVFIFGMAAVFVARYVRFHMMGGSLAGDDPDLAMILDFVMAGAVTFFLTSLLNTRGSEFTLAKTAGIAVMIATMHNMVHFQPTAFGKVFSPEWVEEVVYVTEPNSVLFRGISFVVGEPRTETPPMPSHWQEDGLSGIATEEFSAMTPPVSEVMVSLTQANPPRPMPRPAT
ncbi:MAG: hypothetical protein HKN63_04180 [Rhodobacteraceae bacterium]|nr:hypothetical protein [Paracoccaceae bacterium]